MSEGVFSEGTSSEGVRTRHYHVHGLSVTISADRPEILAALHSRLRYFAVAGSSGSSPASAQPPADLAFTCHTVLRPQEHRLARPSGRSRPLFDFPRGEAIYLEDDRLYLSDGERARLLCEPAHGRAEVSILESELADLWVLSHPLFTVAFVELMKRRGRYSLHAAGLSLGGRGLLLAGMSGAGKSTLSLALLRAGFGFMGDDRLFLSPREGLSEGPEELTVQAFPDEVDVTDETAGFFPELRPLLSRPRSAKQPKRQFWPEELYAVSLVAECAPGALVFPRVAHRAETALAPMQAEEALLELAPNVLLTDAPSSQAHLSALAALVGRSALYRLETGRDFGAVPEMLRELLE